MKREFYTNFTRVESTQDVLDNDYSRRPKLELLELFVWVDCRRRNNIMIMYVKGSFDSL